MDTLKSVLYCIDSYAEWVKREGLPVSEGIALNLFNVTLGDWPRYGVNGAVCHFTGRGDFTNLFLMEIPAGKATNPVRHIFEGVYYVLEGRGSTQIEFEGEPKRSFEWQKDSFFAIPLNAKYRHFNASGTQRALMMHVTLAPMVMKLYHNEEFIFNTPFTFKDRIGREEWYGGEGELHMIRPGNNIWETNVVPDMQAIQLTEWEDRGKDSGNIMFAMANGVMHSHISSIAAATYKKAHRHRAGTHVMTLSGKGYSLLWYDGKENDIERVDWEYGVVFPPCERQFHQHFVTSNNASRYVAIGASSGRYPMTTSQYRLPTPTDSAKPALSRSIRDGGDQIEYQDQRPQIHRLWLDEMKKAGIAPRLDAKELGIPM